MSLVHLEPFAFTGYQENEVSGLQFAQARYYSAETGRFQSEDFPKITNKFDINFIQKYNDFN